MTVGDTAEVKKHKECYYPVARIRAKETGGSGPCIYSGRTEDGEAHTLILTNHHVIEDLITVEKEWDSTLKREYPQERIESATVEFFEYNDYSRAVGSNTYQADVIAYGHKNKMDIGVLELREKEETFENVAQLMPRKEEESIYMFDSVYAVGAALGNPVMATEGEITNVRMELQGQEFIGTNSPITYGNSGGGLFKKGSDGHWYLIGLPARVSLQGWSDVANHIGFAVPIDRIYDFLEENCFEYIWDESYSIKGSKERREEKQREAKEKLLGR